MELTTINPQEYGLNTQTATSIATAFAPKELEFTALVQEYLQVTQMDIDEAVQSAKELKSKYISLEKEINEIHKTQKEYYLRGGQFVDANKNRYVHLITEHKKILTSIEKHEELKKKAEQKKISDARHLELSKYMKDTSHIDLATMQEDVYQAFLSSKKADFDREQELQKSNEIIAKIYQSTDLSSFNASLFGEHIEARKKQLHDAKLLEISNYLSGDLSFDLDTEELQQAYNNRLLVLDGLRIERIKNGMLNAYNNALNTIRRDVYSYVVPVIEVGEFVQEWEAYKSELNKEREIQLKRLMQITYDNSKYTIDNDILEFSLPEFNCLELTKEWNELKELLIKQYTEKANGLKGLFDTLKFQVLEEKNVWTSDKKHCVAYNDLNQESVNHFNKYEDDLVKQLMSDDQLFIDWINSFTLNETTLNNNKVTEVKQKFEAFKKWALNLK